MGSCVILNAYDVPYKPLKFVLGAVQILRKHLEGERVSDLLIFADMGEWGCLNDAYVRHFQNL